MSEDEAEKTLAPGSSCEAEEMLRDVSSCSGDAEEIPSDGPGDSCDAEEIPGDGPGEAFESDSEGTLAGSPGDAAESVPESVTSSDYQTCDDTTPPGSPGVRPSIDISSRSGCSNLCRKKEAASAARAVSASSGDSSGGPSGVASGLRRSNRRRKNRFYLTYDSDFQQESRRRYGLYAVAHK